MPAENQDAHESIQEMQGVVQRGVETLNRLREFGRGARDEGRQGRSSRVAHEAVGIGKPRLHSRHDLRVTLREDLGKLPDVLVRRG